MQQLTAIIDTVVDMQRCTPIIWPPWSPECCTSVVLGAPKCPCTLMFDAALTCRTLHPMWFSALIHNSCMACNLTNSLMCIKPVHWLDFPFCLKAIFDRGSYDQMQIRVHARSYRLSRNHSHVLLVDSETESMEALEPYNEATARAHLCWCLCL